MKKKLVSSVTASGGPNAMIYKLDDIPDSVPYKQLYEEYSLRAVKVQFMPQETVNQTAGTANFVIPTITTSVDTDDNTTAWSETDLMQRMNARVTLFNKPVTRYIKVKPSQIQDFGARMNSWFSTDQSDIPYYGLKYIVSNGGGSSQQSYYRVITTYYFAFKTGKTKNT